MADESIHYFMVQTSSYESFVPVDDVAQYSTALVDYDCQQ